jgi:hypothetical protein
MSPSSEVVRKRIVVRQVQDELVLELLDGHVRSIRTGDDFEAVVKKGLGLVVREPKQLDTFEGFTACRPGKHHTYGDVVVVARLQGERTGRLQKQPVARRIARADLGPRIHRHPAGSPGVGVGVAGEHVVRGNLEVSARSDREPVAAVGHALAVFPVATHVVVVLLCKRGLAVDAVVPIVVDELPHPVALVVSNPIAVADADAGIRDAQRVHSVREYGGQRVIEAIFVLVGSLEEVHAHGRRVFAVTDRVARGVVERVAVVGIAESATHVAAHVVVHVAPEVRIHPLGEVGFSQGLGALVDQHVVIELHVVNLVVRREGEGLGTDLHTDGLALRLGVDVALVVEDPVVVLVTVEGNGVVAAALFAVDFLEKVKPRIITGLRIVEAVAVVVVKWREVEVLVEGRVAVSRIGIEIRRNAVAVGEELGHVARGVSSTVEVLAVADGVCPVGDGDFIVSRARGGVDLRGTIVRQGTGPKIVPRVAVAHRGELQLLVRADSAEPQRTAVHRGDAAFLRDHEGPFVDGAVVPQGAAVFDEGADVVPFEVAKGRRRGAPFGPLRRGGGVVHGGAEAFLGAGSLGRGGGHGKHAS